MANAVKDILMSWGFDDLIELFQDHQIDQEAFDSLTDDAIKELIPKIGPRLIFSKKYALYKTPFAVSTPSSCASDDTLIDDTSCKSNEVLSPTPSELTDESPPMVLEHTMVANLGMSEEQSQNTPYAIAHKAHQETCLKVTNLQALLQSSNKGKLILSYYNVNEKLDSNLRDKLTELIIDNEIESDLNKRILIERFEILAHAIVGLFPSEIKEVYFSYSFKRSHNGSFLQMGTGKLFRRYYNSRRTLRNSGLLPKSIKQPLAVEVDISNNEDDKVIWLKNSIEPWAEVIEMWKSTYIQRNCYRTEEMSIMQYMQTFPALKQQLGYTLLEIDFETMYPQCDSLLVNITSFCDKILVYARTLKTKEVINYLKCFEKAFSIDVRNLYVLLLLPLLLKATVVKKLKGGGYWKPSKIEVTDGFILHVKICGDIKPSLERKQNKLATFGLSIQPIPVLVGQALENITASYVAIDNILYDVPTPLKAVDICFKAIHSLNACYSKESEMVWTLLQKGIYRLNTKYDKNYISVESLLNEL